jgi:hypothetical protein
MSGKQLYQLEHRYLMALCVVDLYRLQGLALVVGAAHFAACEGLDWNEYEELKDHLERKGIECHGS